MPVESVEKRKYVDVKGFISLIKMFFDCKSLS